MIVYMLVSLCVGCLSGRRADHDGETEAFVDGKKRGMLEIGVGKVRGGFKWFKFDSKTVL